jgi:hypothetical protein
MAPHSLRRTFASILVALRQDPATVMRQMGHTTPHMTLGVYAAAMDWADGERDALRALVEGDVRQGLGDSASEEAAAVDERHGHETENPAVAGVFSHGRGWARTSDLSRVRRALSH